MTSNGKYRPNDKGLPSFRVSDAPFDSSSIFLDDDETIIGGYLGIKLTGKSIGMMIILIFLTMLFLFQVFYILAALKKIIFDGRKLLYFFKMKYGKTSLPNSLTRGQKMNNPPD